MANRTITGGTWTYSGDPTASTLDEVRFLVTDTDQSDQLISDEEILYLITDRGSARGAAADACERIALEFAKEASEKQVGDLRLSLGERAASFESRAKSLRSDRERFKAIVPRIGGVSVSDKRARERDADRTTPAFRRGMHDNPDAAQQGGSNPSTRWGW